LMQIRRTSSVRITVGRTDHPSTPAVTRFLHLDITRPYRMQPLPRVCCLPVQEPPVRLVRAARAAITGE
jgi:hypothetical protein